MFPLPNCQDEATVKSGRQLSSRRETPDLPAHWLQRPGCGLSNLAGGASSDIGHVGSGGMIRNVLMVRDLVLTNDCWIHPGLAACATSFGRW